MTSLRLLSTLALLLSVSTSSAQIQRWDFSGRVIDVVDLDGILFPDVFPGDPIEGHFQYAPTSSGKLDSCSEESPPYDHIQNRFTTGVNNFSAISYEIRNPRTDERYTVETSDGFHFESRTFSDFHDGLSLVEVRENFGDPTERGGVGEHSIFLLGETEIDPLRMPTQLSLDDYPDAGLEFFWFPFAQDVEGPFGDFRFISLSAAIFELEPVPYDPAEATNPAPLASKMDLPLTRPGITDTFSTGKRPEAISDDGNISITGFGESFVFSTEYGVAEMPTPPGYGLNGVNQLSADGQILVGELIECGENSSRIAYRWTQEGGYQLLGTPNGEGSSRAHVISADGQVIAGWSRSNDINAYWTWTESAGFTVHPELVSSPQAISADGTVLVDNHGNVIRPDGHFNLGGMGDDDRVNPRDMSSDGSVIVGLGLRPTDSVGGAFVWTPDGLRPLGVLDVETHDRSVANAVTADGTTVVGYSYSSDSENRDERAFVWTEAHGMRELITVLVEEYGMDAEEFDVLSLPMARAIDISSDGRSLVGSSLDFELFGSPDDPESIPWTLHLDWPLGSLQGDFSSNGSFDAADADALITAILEDSSDPLFDLQRDNDLDIGDLNELLERAGRLTGDANFDGNVDFADFLVLSSNFGESGLWSHGDFDASGDVAFADFLLLSNSFGATSAINSVPEPSSLPIFGLTFIGLITQIRRGLS